MFWLVTQMWILLLVAFLAGVGVGAWVFAGQRAGRPKAAEAAPPPARAPLNLLSAPAGAGEDLTQIIGIDPPTQERLNTIGVFHLRQIADWDDEAARWIEAQLEQPDRVTREQWTEQAQSLI